MGLIHPGLPHELALTLRDKYHLRDFVETGAHVGKTAAWAAHEFQQVYSLELAPEYVQKARIATRPYRNAFILQMDSRRGLGSVLELLFDAALIWLDAHWSPDLPYPRPEAGECPVIAELAQIAKDGRPHVILIDDARYFLDPPPPPHIAAQWPAFETLQKIMMHTHTCVIQEDVLVFEPK